MKEHKKKSVSKITKGRLSMEEFLLANKLLKAVYNHFCNISYADTRKKTFDEMGMNKEVMSLNRFMLFCKEFNMEVIVRSELVGENGGLNHENQHEKTHQSKTKMVEIPVKGINKVEKKLTKIYKSHTAKSEQMTYE